MKLWVDDIRNAPNESWTVARNVTSAIGFIYIFREGIDEISLDHDISQQVTVGETSRPYPSPETFRSVAHYVAAVYSGAEKKPKITIHSANPVGSKFMQELLEEHGFSDITYAPMGAANRLETEV